MSDRRMRQPKRNEAFRPAREPVRHDTALQLDHGRVTGPLPFLNPTRAHYRHEARPDARFKWTSRNDRKGRHAVVVDRNQSSAAAKHTTPQPTSSPRTIARNIWRMLTYYPVWDISFDVAYIFTIGSVIWIFNAFFVFLPLVQPGTEFENEELYGGGITAFIGATVFEFGSFLLLAEAINEGRSGCFGWAVKQVLSHEEGEASVALQASRSHCIHPHNKRKSVGNGHTDASKHLLQSHRHSWVWWPSNEELRTHYIHNLGFIASLSQFLGATIFWVAGFTALPGIYDRMSQTVAIVLYWTPQAVGGLGFIISGSFFMIETQSKWWKPAPRTLGWWVGALNTIGGVGFTLCPAFGYDSNSWAQYQASLSTFWGSWAFMAGSTLQWYESLEKFPVEFDRNSQVSSSAIDSEELPSIYSDFGTSLGFSMKDSQNRTMCAKETHSNVVDWEGRDDAANPRNFSKSKKTINIACIFFMSFVSPFTSTVVAPAIPDIMRDFVSTDAYLSAFVLSIYVLGYAFGPLLISPLSEQYGRLPLYHVCNVLFTACTLACGFSNSLGTLAILRFLAGVGGSNVFALAPSSLADLVVKEERGSVMALIGMAYNLGPAISPTAGSYLNEAKGWRAIFYLTAILGGGGTILSMVCMSETYEPVLLRQKAARLRKQTSNPELRAKTDVHVEMGRLRAFRKAMAMPFNMLFFSRPIFFTSLLTAIGYGYIYILYTTIPTTFVETYRWAPKKLGLAYLGTAVGNLIGMLGGGAVSDGLIKRKALRGDKRPENRLLPMIFWWPLVSVELFLYAWTAQYAVHWIVPLIGTAIFGAGAMSAIFFTGTYILDAYPLHSASDMAACSVMRSLIGGLAPLFSHKMYQKLDVGWSFSLLAFIALVFAPVPWVFYTFGEKWRGRERYTGEDEASSLNSQEASRQSEMVELEAKSVTKPILPKHLRNCTHSMASDPPPAHRTASTPKTPTSKPTGTTIITVGTSESTSRTWTLSQETLAQHSSYYRRLFAAESSTSHTLLLATPHAFANFVDYLHSNIYSTNTQVANYSAMRAHTDACILGAKLGARVYTESAIRALHALFEPLAESESWDERQSTIREADVEYVCIHAEEKFLPPGVEDVGALTGLRRLFFDALAAHWSRRHVLDLMVCRINAGVGAASRSGATWTSLWFGFPEFAERVGDTWRVMGMYRRGLLKGAEDYFCVSEGDTDIEEGERGDADEEDDDDEDEIESEENDEDGDVIMDKGKAKSTAKESFLNRRKNGESKKLWLKVRGLRSKSNVGQTEEREEEREEGEREEDMVAVRSENIGDNERRDNKTGSEDEMKADMETQTKDVETETESDETEEPWVAGELMQKLVQYN
ncbi:integral membrane protein [Stemphylium lycopersici]|nr:integral membrane protein [Stemphylium lycopersici]